MTQEKHIHFIGHDPLVFELYQSAINERNDLEANSPDYRLQQGTTDADGNAIYFLHLEEDAAVAWMQDTLERQPECRLFVSVRPDKRRALRAIAVLEVASPLAVIGVAMQPIQPGRLWEFLDRVEAKTIHFEWEEGDLDGL